MPILILILAALLVYLLYGDKLAQTLSESAGQQVEETIQPDGARGRDITMPEDGETDDTW